MEKPNLQQIKEFTEFLSELIIELNLQVDFETKVSIDKWEDDSNLIKQSNCFIKGIVVPHCVAQSLLKEIEKQIGE